MRQLTHRARLRCSRGRTLLGRREYEARPRWRSDMSRQSAHRPSSRSGRMSRPTIAALLLATSILTGPAAARITRIEIAGVESPAFEGRTFGAVGQYEKLTGRAFGE